MRPSRVFRLLFRIFIYLLTLSVTVVSILGGFSAFLILSNRDNIQPDLDNAEINLYINNSTFEIENINFSLPFKLNNTGYFDLENLEIGIQLFLNYSHIDGMMNDTKVVKILDKTQNFGDIPKGVIGNFTFVGENSSFIYSNFPNPITEINWLRGPPALEFYANFTVSLDYSIGMHSLSITILNIFVGDSSPY